MSEEQIVPVTDISADAMREFKRQLRSLGWKTSSKWIKLASIILLLIGMAYGSLFFIFFLVGGLIVWYTIIRHKMQARFWNEFAAARGWSYTSNKSIVDEKALLFREGENRAALHAVTGSYREQPFSIFEYTYTRGSGKSKTTYSYTVFEVKFDGAFPHLYLNDRHNSDYLALSEKLSLPKLALPPGFEKQYVLYAPKQYEIEALQIFSPETLGFLLGEKWPHDFELVEHELIIVRPSRIETRAELERELADIQKLIDHLAPKLNHINFTPVGDYKPTL